MFRNRRYEDRGDRSFAPINVGDEIDVNIEAVGEKGDGIAKVKGFVIFVPGTKQGENVKVKISKVLRKVGFAEVIGKASSKKKAEGEDQEMEASNEDSEETSESTEETYSESEDSSDFGEEP